MSRSEHYVLPCVFTRCPDVAGAWLAECVPLAVITQGDNLEHAVEMLLDAVRVSVEDDLARGRSLLSRSADPEAAALLSRLSATLLAELTTGEVEADPRITACMATFELSIDREGHTSNVTCKYVAGPPVPPAAVA